VGVWTCIEKKVGHMASQYNSDSLHGIRDNALLLSLGHKYHCQESLLKKFGDTIDSHLIGLVDDIAAIKKKYPGKFMFQQKVDANAIIEELHRTAERLKSPDKEITKKCSAGEVGKKMETAVELLIQAIDEILVQVEGRAVRYTAKDAIIKQFGLIGIVFRALGRTMKAIIKTAFILTFIALIPLTFLFVTMEKESRLQENIAKMKSLIYPQKRVLAECDEVITEISRKVEALREASEDLSRQQMVEIMDLNVKIHTLSEKRRKAEIAIGVHENDIMEKTAKLESLKKKSFVEKLLRR
jgi:SMC interacting uncharacterized protein involved in chromosome segregation